MRNIILIVDDIEMNRAILSSVFEDTYQILEAENGQEALELIRIRERRSQLYCWMWSCR